MRTVALATCTELPHLDGDEDFLVRALKARDIEPAILAWDGGDAPFLAHSLTVIRSTWDYTARVDEFVAWAERLELALKKRGSALENGASVVRWNTHKRYLVELAAEGVATVPTHIIARGTHADLAALCDERGWRGGAVVKPAVSAGSRDTVRITSDFAEAQRLVDALAPTRDLMLQPFVAGVASGELSLIYVDGAFSHAVNKVPKSGDFRSQPEFGSDVKRVEPTAAERAAADKILGIVGGKLLYARVDLVRGDDGAPWLMELELVEPSLYLAWDDDAAARVADAIARRL